MGYAALVFRFDLGLAFAVAGLSKLRDLRAFTEAVFGYKLVSDRVGVLIARLLPPTEAALGLLLLLGLAGREAAAAIGVLLAVFTGAIVINLARGREIDCGCVGSGVTQTITWFTVIRNICLLGAAAVVVSANPVSLGLDSLIPGMGGAQIPNSSVFAFMTIAIVLTMAAQLVADFRRLRTALRAPTLTLRGVTR